MEAVNLAGLRAWAMLPAPRFVGGNRVELLQGGDELFPRMVQAIGAARREVWLATYIFHADPAALSVAQALKDAAVRGVAVHVVVDGFGSMAALPALRKLLAGSSVRLEVFRPLDRWYAWLQPGQLRRLHQKLCACDGEQAFVGGVNLIDDRHDQNHGWGEAPRLDFSVALNGPLAVSVQDSIRAIWTRAHLGGSWRAEFRSVARGPRPFRQAVAVLRQMRNATPPPEAGPDAPVQAAFLVRDNLRQRRTIERSYVEAIRRAEVRIDLAVPYFYPGHSFMRALRRAARRGVAVRLLLQGKLDYRIAGLAARALYDDLRRHGVAIYEYTPAFLHAKVAVVDHDWATVGSSNIDPLSLLLNLEANLVIRDADFAAALTQRFEQAVAVSALVPASPTGLLWSGWARRGLVAWLANVYLRIAGITGRY
jgi:cardiolipin synthase